MSELTELQKAMIEHDDDMARRDRTMISNPTTTEQSVEQALAELREMFPGEVFRVEVSKDVRMDEDGNVSWSRDHACVLQPSRGLDGFYNAPTLRDAMDLVRQWHAEQGKKES